MKYSRSFTILTATLLFSIGCFDSSNKKKHLSAKDNTNIESEDEKLIPEDVAVIVKEINRRFDLRMLRYAYNDFDAMQDNIIVNGEIRSRLSLYEVEINKLGFSTIWHKETKSVIAIPRHLNKDKERGAGANNGN